jgi:hypothetical protein
VNKRRDTRSISNYFLPALSILAVAAVGCAGQTPAAHDARAAGEWTFRLPESGSPYAGLAIGNPGQPTQGLAMVDDALATTAAKTETPAAPKARPALARTVVAENARDSVTAPQPLAATPPSLPAVATTQPEQLALNTPATNVNEESRYSQREQQSQKQRDFRGGDAIVITASTLVVILLIVILILLLT